MKLRINDRTKYKGKPIYDVMSGRTWISSFHSFEEAQAYINDRENGREGESENVRILRDAIKDCQTELFMIDDDEFLFTRHWKMEFLSRNQPDLTPDTSPFNQPRPRIGGN